MAFSVEFEPLDWWTIPYFGLYWQTISSEFPKPFAAPPIPSSIENFELAAPPPVDAINLQFGIEPNNVRCSFISDSGTDAVQVQRDRLVRNWQRTHADTTYPRYANHMRPAFERCISGFSAFLGGELLGKPAESIRVKQIEVTYVNDFEKGREWTDYPDLGGILKLWQREPSTSFLPNPYGMRAGISYQMSEGPGRLHVVVQRAIRPRDMQEVLQMRLMARHRPDSSDLNSIMRSADLCREWIVRGFTDLTTDRMHQLWGRT